MTLFGVPRDLPTSQITMITLSIPVVSSLQNIFCTTDVSNGLGDELIQI